MNERRTTVHLVRHADALPDPDALLADGAGYDNLPLSHKGRAQAAALAERMRRNRHVAAVYASPTLRARETAQAIATAFDLSVNTDDRLREVHLGDDGLDGIPAAERAAAVRARLAELATIAMRDGSWRAVPGAEDAGAIRARVGAAVSDIVAAHAGETVAIVSHAGTLNAYLAGVVGTPRDFFFPIGNASLNTVAIAGERTTVLRLNDTAHLEREEATAERGSAGGLSR